MSFRKGLKYIFNSTVIRLIYGALFLQTIITMPVYPYRPTPTTKKKKKKKKKKN